MKNTIHGFQQKAIIELGLTHDECLVLRWFVDFTESEKMRTETFENKTFYWVNYQSVLINLPILRFKKRQLQNVFKKMVNTNVLCHLHIKKDGSFSFYAFGSSFKLLIPPPTKKIITTCIKPETIHDIKEVTPVKETKPPKKASRLPDHWKPSDKLIEWVIEKQKEKKITLDIPDVTFEFCNYWHSKAGANATKIDWDKTFQNWIIRQFQYAPKYKQPEKPTAQKPVDYYDTSKNKYFIERD